MTKFLLLSVLGTGIDHFAKGSQRLLESRGEAKCLGQMLLKVKADFTGEPGTPWSMSISR